MAVSGDIAPKFLLRGSHRVHHLLQPLADVDPGEPRRTNIADTLVPMAPSSSPRSKTGDHRNEFVVVIPAPLPEVGVQTVVDDGRRDVVECGPEPVPDLMHLLQRQRYGRKTAGLFERHVGRRMPGHEGQAALEMGAECGTQALAQYPEGNLVDRACVMTPRRVSVSRYWYFVFYIISYRFIGINSACAL